MPGRSLTKVGNWHEYVDEDGETQDREFVTRLQDADVINSLSDRNPEFNAGKNFAEHRPVLDIDLPCKLIESSTPGHYHLFIEHSMFWPDYVELLDALAKAGIVQPGYVNASKERGYTSVRLPWVKKEPTGG